MLEIPSISNARCKKISTSKFLIRNTYYFNRNLRFSIEILGILIEILGFTFEILGISKKYNNFILYALVTAEGKIASVKNSFMKSYFAFYV